MLLGRLPEFRPSAAASHIGYINPEEYVPFLVAFREIVEGHGSVDEKLAELKKLPTRSAEFTRFWKHHRKQDADFPESFFWCEFSAALQGVGPKTTQALFKAGYRTPDEISAAAVEELAAVKGVGKARAAQIHPRGRPLV